VSPSANRPCCAADKRDEVAALHSITSWALACSISGVVKPGGLFAFGDAIDVGCCATVEIRLVHPLGDKHASGGEGTIP